MKTYGNITSANSVLMLGVLSLYAVPQQMQGFAADDMYSLGGVDNAEVVMGADARMSAGWIPQIKTLDITLQADSEHNAFFESWYAAQEAGKTIYKGFGIITQESIGMSYALTNGVLCNYSPLADGKKVLQPRKFQIKWESVIGAPI